MRPSFALLDVAPFVETGGYINIINLKNGKGKSLFFKDGEVEHAQAEMKLTDSKSQTIMKKDLQEAVAKLLDLGVSIEEIQSLVTEQMIVDLFKV